MKKFIICFALLVAGIFQSCEESSEPSRPYYINDSFPRIRYEKSGNTHYKKLEIDTVYIHTNEIGPIAYGMGTTAYENVSYENLINLVSVDEFWKLEPYYIEKQPKSPFIYTISIFKSDKESKSIRIYGDAIPPQIDVFMKRLDTLTEILIPNQGE
ncbi:MAG: hypothetical protein V4642_02495 [Bacteroidota bacterium]